MRLSHWLFNLPQRICGTFSIRSKRHSRAAERFTSRLETLETRTVLAAPQFISFTDWTVPENDPFAALVEATDADNDPLTFSIAGTGADDALFTIDPQTGELNFLVPPNFEQPTDANGDGIYEVDVDVTDIINAPVTQSLILTIHDVDDETPVFFSGTTVDVDEGILAVTNVVAIDADAASVLEYTLTGNGADDALFTIDSATGFVEFAILTDFANPVDADQNNVYEFEVQVSDGVQSATQQVQVTVKQAAVNPVIAFNDGAVTFKKKDQPIKIAPFFTATGNNLGGGTLIVSISNVNTGKKRADRFEVGVLAAVGTTDTVLTNGRYVTTVSLHAGVTADDVQDTVRNLTFFTSKKGLKFTTRNVKIQLIDSNFNVSNEVTKTINVRKK